MFGLLVDGELVDDDYVECDDYDRSQWECGDRCYLEHCVDDGDEDCGPVGEVFECEQVSVD